MYIFMHQHFLYSKYCFLINIFHRQQSKLIINQTQRKQINSKQSILQIRKLYIVSANQQLLLLDFQQAKNIQNSLLVRFINSISFQTFSALHIYSKHNITKISSSPMGNNRRKQNKHRNNNNNNNNHNNHNSNQYPKANEQQLQMECLELYQLLSNKTKILKDQELNYCYLISTKWLEDWKDYVGYYNLTEDDPKKHKKIGKKHPGKINHQLTTSNLNFYTIPKTMPDYQFMNKVVSEKKDQYQDYIGIAKSIWDVFASKYDHVEIQRPKRVTKSGSVIYDGYMLQIDVIFVDYTNDQLMKSIEETKSPKKSLDQDFPCDKMNLSQLWQLKNLHEFMREYCQNVYGSQQFTLSKGYGFMTSGGLQKQIWQGIHDNSKTFPVGCRQLKGEKYDDLDLDQFLRSYYTLIVEVGQSHFKPAQIPQELEGYCEQCVQKKKLIQQCQCGQMLYCSEQCRIVDQVWHSKLCNKAFDSQDDEQYSKKKKIIEKEGLPICGIDNLGNTCYMNSVIQSLLSIEELVKFFAENIYKKQIDEKQFEDNKGRLLQKWSKTIKMCMQTKSSVAPWPFKGQVNQFLPPFKGFKQHDANDFLVNLINAFNQQLKKVQGKMYHQLFQSKFLGQFSSVIRCPDCHDQIKNDQIFSQISLPLKQKAKIQTANYVTYESPFLITKGRLVVQDTWQSIRKSVGVNSDCLLMAAREGQHAVDLQQDQSPQKTVKKVKRQLIFYPNCTYSQSDRFYSCIPITQKQMYGQTMKTPYGYPAILNVSLQLHTLGSFWVEAIKVFCDESIIAQAVKIKETYFKEIQQCIKKNHEQSTQMSQQQSLSKQEQSQKKTKQEKQQQNQEKQIQKKANDQLTALVQKQSIKLFINDLKRHRNQCAFCKKKCNGCSVDIDFGYSMDSFLEGKQNQVSFEIMLKQKISIQKIQKDVGKTGQANLHDSFQIFSQPQQLDQQNAWYCSTCDMMRLAHKQMTIKCLPEIFILHLNRFKSDGDKKVKNSDPIEYGEYQEFKGQKYQLLSVIVHQGSTQGGHYWAICRRNNAYYIFNDSKVTETKNICNKNAYVLIYKKIHN